MAGVLLAGVGGVILTQPHARLPNPALTPGVVRTTDRATICRPGYTATVRVSLTQVEQRQVDAAYRWTSAPGKQEYDHLIPLELGGGNGVANIWPEPITEARQKDHLENSLHAAVCAGRISVSAAQTCIRVDWIACARRRF